MTKSFSFSQKIHLHTYTLPHIHCHTDTNPHTSGRLNITHRTQNNLQFMFDKRLICRIYKNYCNSEGKWQRTQLKYGALGLERFSDKEHTALAEHLRSILKGPGRSDASGLKWVTYSDVYILHRYPYIQIIQINL